MQNHYAKLLHIIPNVVPQNITFSTKPVLHNQKRKSTLFVKIADFRIFIANCNVIQVDKHELKTKPITSWPFLP